MASSETAEEVAFETRPVDRSRDQVIAAIEEGLADVEAGRVISHEDLRAELEAEFGPFDV